MLNRFFNEILNDLLFDPSALIILNFEMEVFKEIILKIINVLP